MSSQHQYWLICDLEKVFSKGAAGTWRWRMTGREENEARTASWERQGALASCVYEVGAVTEGKLFSLKLAR